MLQEQKERIIEIIENIGTAQGLPSGVTIQVLAHQVDSLDNIQLPAMLLATENIPYNLSLGSKDLYQSDCRWKWYLFIRKVGTGNQAQAEIEPNTLLDILATEFLSRPHLEFGGSTGLDNVSDRITFSATGDTSRPMNYPPNINSSVKYWGLSGNLTIPYIQQIELATS